MNINRQKSNFENFRLVIENFINTEKEKISQLGEVRTMLKDKNLDLYLTQRETFLNFCVQVYQQIADREYSTELEPFLEKNQKEFYFQTDTLKKDGLKLLAANQLKWFNLLFNNHFPFIKILLRNLLTNETPADKATMERVIQEIELVKFKGK